MRKRLATLMAAALTAGGVGMILTPAPTAAAPPAPIILNNGSQNGSEAQWAETQGLPDDGGVRTFFATFLVEHAPGRSIPAVRMDANFDATDNTGSVANTAVTAQTFVSSAGRLDTSRVTVGINVTKPGGFTCPLVGSATRVVDAPIRMAVVDNTGEKSSTVSTTVRFVEDSNCNARADYPRLTAASQNLTSVTPGQSITYTFTCDDVDADVFSSDDDCDRANIRWRRLDDGATSGITLKTGIDDNTSTSHVMSFPSQGHYVVEAQLGNEDGSFPQTGGTTGGWWRLGNADVNDAASTLSGVMTFPGAAASSPPSVNAGTAINAVAEVADAGGQVQAIEWDATNDGSFERFEYTVPSKSGGDIVHPSLTTAERTQSVSTTTPGLRTVQARITDNGALDGADNIRRQLTFNGQLRINALPVASNGSITLAEDAPTATLNLTGSDPDNQPAPIEYHLVSGLSNPSLGTLGTISGNQIEFTPAPNAFGSATFTFRVRDGNAGTVGANGFSNTATFTINVTSVNDLPTVDPKTLVTDEDTPGTVQLTGTDVEDGTNLTYSVNPGGDPAHGNVSCTTSGLCTYTPDPDFFGADSFVVRGTDSDGGFSTATVSVTVNPVNDAPVANDQSVTLDEDTVGLPITLTASDVDNTTLSFVAPVDDVQHGALSCLGDTCTYTPDPDYNGPDSFTFKANDGQADSNLATVSITVVPVNDNPVAIDVTVDTDEDVAVVVPADGTDVDGDTVTVDAVTDPAHGSATITGPNDVTYLGDLNFNGIDTFDFTVVDGNGGSDDGTATVIVHAVNDAPEIADQAFTLDEDTPTILSLVAGDVDGDLLTWSIVGGPSHGTLVGTGPDVAYIPDANYFGTDSFTVMVNDGNGGTATATIDLTIDPVNDQPVADATSVATDEDVAVDITLTGSDVDGDTLTFTAPVVAPTNGTIVCTGPDCTYTPFPDFHGSDLLTFSVDDGNGGSDSASVSITVHPVNDSPVAVGSAVTTDEDAAVGITLTASDVDGDPLTFAVGSASNGVVSGSGPNVVYTPNPNFHGSDSFGFTVDDGNGGSDSAVVAILVSSVNDAPVATGGSAVTEEDTPVSFQLGGTDVDGDTLTYTVPVPPAEGSLVCDTAGACTYDPAPDFSGTVVIDYVVSDGDLSSNGVFTVIVDPVNDPPTASPVAVLVAEDHAAAFDLTATDPEGDALTYAVVSPPAHGTLECSPSGSCTYTPAANYHGPDGFTWSVSDGGPAVNGTATITVVPVNDAPQALDVSAETDEDTPVSVLLIATDVEGDPITYSVDSLPLHGSVTVAGNVATYTPAQDFSGLDQFTYRATDPSGAFTTARVTIVVNEVPLIGTSLVGDAAVARVLVSISGGFLNGGLTVFPLMRATLRKADGTGLGGRTITFTIGGNHVCSAVTNASGVGECSTQAALASLLNLGYQVSFAGDADHAASSARGPILQVLTLRL